MAARGRGLLPLPPPPPFSPIKFSERGGFLFLSCPIFIAFSVPPFVERGGGERKRFGVGGGGGAGGGGGGEGTGQCNVRQCLAGF